MSQFEDQRTTVYKVDPEHPEDATLPTLRTEELLLNMGPQHPSTHGVLKVILELEGERLVKSTPVMGFLHRGVEKLAEEGTYHQFIPHTDRLDYVCAMYNNFAYCRAVEKLMNITVPDRAEYLRTIVAEIQRIIANYLGAKAGALAMAGRAWLGSVLFAYVGLLIGSLAAVRTTKAGLGPLAQQLAQRVTLFGEAFRQIVAAQFWIAAFNTLLTALFLLFILPMWDMALPYTPVLITLTFVAGLVPIVGNLLCNVVMTIVGLSVSPLAAAACLGFLILIHKAEYVINAKVVGQRTQMGVWELLSVMFVAEAVFGPAGLVAAPLFYAYLKKELVAARLV